MAPAATDTMYQHFQDTGRSPSYYDLILTGDLGYIGKDIVIDLMQQRLVDIFTINFKLVKLKEYC